MRSDSRTRGSSPPVPCTKCAVIDIETIIDADAAGRAPSSRRSDGVRSALHRLTCATVLTFEEARGDGEIRDPEIVTFHAGDMDEVAIIGSVDLSLPSPKEGARLITYNGAYDLRVLLHRAATHWMFDLPQLVAWGDERFDHYDVMRRGAPTGSAWSLADMMAGIGLEIRRPAAPGTARELATGDYDGLARRNRCDVMATMLGYAYQRSLHRRCPVPAATAWLALEKLSKADRFALPHGPALHRHHLVRVARERLQGHKPRACGCREVAA